MTGAAKLLVSIVATLSTHDPAHTAYLCELICELLHEATSDDDAHDLAASGSGEDEPMDQAKSPAKPPAAAAAGKRSDDTKQSGKSEHKSSHAVHHPPLIGALSAGERYHFQSHASVIEALAPISRFLESVITGEATTGSHHPPTAVPIESKRMALSALYRLALARASASELIHVARLLVSNSELALSLTDLEILRSFEAIRADARSPTLGDVFGSVADACAFATDSKQSGSDGLVRGAAAATFILAQMDRISRSVCPVRIEHLHYANTNDVNSSLTPIIFHPCAIDLHNKMMNEVRALLDTTRQQLLTASASAKPDDARRSKALTSVLMSCLRVLKVQFFEMALVASIDTELFVLEENEYLPLRKALFDLAGLKLAGSGASGSGGGDFGALIRNETEIVIAFGYAVLYPSVILMGEVMTEVLDRRAAILVRGGWV